MRKRLNAIFGAGLCAIALVVSADPTPTLSAEFPRMMVYGGMPAPEGPLAVALPHLREFAARGSGEAAASAYAGLTYCRNTAPFDAEHAATYCAGISKKDLDDAFVWLDLAAELGDMAAMYGFVTGWRGEFEADTRQNNSAARRTVMASRADQYLERLIAMCHRDALGFQYDKRSREGAADLEQSERGYVLSTLYGERWPSPRFARTRLNATDAREARARGKTFLQNHCRRER